LIAKVSKARGEEAQLPDWTLIRRISRDKHNYRSALERINGLMESFRSREEREKTAFLLILVQRPRARSLRGSTMI
jgi:hypothetical protein